MDKKNFVKKLVELFSTEQVEETMEFMDIKTIDGRILRVSEMAVDKSITEITEEGEIALEDGEYTMEDGLVVSVMDGMIKEISTPEEEIVEDEVIVEEEMTEEVIEEEVDMDFENLMSEIKSMIDEVKSLSSLKEEFNSLKEENETLKTKVEEFSKAPSAEPTKIKVDFKKDDKINKSVMYNILSKK